MSRLSRAFKTVLVIVVACSVTTLTTLRARAQTEEPVANPSDALFDDSVLQEIRLRIHSSDWTALKQNFQSNTYYPCDLVFRGQTIRNIGIRSRGSGSRNPNKPGLRVDFDRYSTDQEFLGLKSFVLDNLAQDKSGIKERLAMKLFQRRGLPAPREAHARLYVNDVYVGLYAAVESIDKRFLKRFAGLDADGFLFEFNWIDVWRFAYLGEALETYQLLFSAKTHEKDAISTLYSPIEEFVRVVNTATDIATDLQPYLDPALFLRFLAVEQFVAEGDGLTGYAGMNNFYLYRTPSRTEFKFVAWDKDVAFDSLDRSAFLGTSDNVLTRRLLELPGNRTYYVNMILETMASANALEGATSPDGLPITWLQDQVERQYAQVRAAMYSDVNKPYTNDEFEASIEFLRTFARERGLILTNEVQPQP